MEEKLKNYEYLIDIDNNQRFLQIKYSLIKFIGPEIATFLTYILSKQDYYKNNNQLTDINKGGIKEEGYFYLYQDKIISDICISKHRQTEILTILKELEIIKIIRNGIPAKNYYKVDSDRIILYCRLCEEGKILSIYDTVNVKKRVDPLKSSSNNVSSLIRQLVETTNYYVSPYIILNNYINNIILDFCFSKEKQYCDSDESQNVASTNKLLSNNVVKEKKDKTMLVNTNLDTLQESKEQENVVKETQTVVTANNSGHQLIRKKKQEDIVNIRSQPISKILSFWKNSGLVQHREGTKIVDNANAHLSKLYRGTFFNNTAGFEEYFDRKFTEQEIIDSIKNFSLAATSVDYQPAETSYKDHLKKTNLDFFFFNPHSETNRSLFIKYLTKPELVSQEKRLVKDVDEETTRILKSLYIKNILGGIEPIAFSNIEENNFRRATILLTKWFESNKKSIANGFDLRGSDIMSKRARCELVFEALLECTSGNTVQINTGWLCSSKMYDDRLVKYMNDQNMLN